jgi:hypothetical protein
MADWDRQFTAQTEVSNFAITVTGDQISVMQLAGIDPIAGETIPIGMDREHATQLRDALTEALAMLGENSAAPKGEPGKPEPRVWKRDDREPGPEVRAVRDVDGEIWSRDPDGDGWVYDRDSSFSVPWNHILGWAPLTVAEVRG